jgi:hypothetical protein
MSTFPKPIVSTPIAIRGAAGLLQGLALYLLYQAAESQVWPATDGLLFAPLVVIGWLLPVVVLMGVANMRPRTLAIWSACAALLLAGLTVHDVLRDPERIGSLGSIWTFWNPMRGSPDLRIWPSSRLFPAILLILFVSQTLIVAADADRKLIGSYPRQFEAAWKHAVQLGLSLIFVGLFWLLLALGAGLFNLIKLDFLGRLIQHRWFAMPATALAFACAVHVTDVRAGIVRGVRTLIHVLLSWLLPLMALFAAGFLASLPFTGLAPLWSTRFASSLLLTAAFVSVLLINSTYQDGESDGGTPRLLRWAASLAGLLLVPLVALAGYALALRIEQHGWTSDRIFALASSAVAASCALGYAGAVIRRGAWLKGIERVNIVAAFIALAAVLALYTPIADPARISVRDQMARLESGRTSATEFDYAYLRFEGGRYGQAALERLKEMPTGPNAADIRRKAEAALTLKNRWDRGSNPPTAQNLAQHIAVYPEGRTLPDSFVRQDWSLVTDQRWMLPQCLVDGGAQCDAFLLDLSGNGIEDILLIDITAAAVRAAVFRQDRDSKWQMDGTVPGGLWCPNVREALRAGKFKIVPAAFNDIDVGGYRVHVATNGPTKCP